MPFTGRPKSVMLRWASFKGYAAVATFTLIAIFFETFVIFLFLRMGLRDTAPIIHILYLPGTQLTLTVVISSLFHLLPLGVILVLVSCWTYLTRCLSIPRRRPPLKPARRVQPIRKKSRSIWGRIERWISTKTKGFSKAIEKSSEKLVKTLRLTKINAWFEKRLFIKVTLKSSVMVTFSFIVFISIAYLMEHPTTIYNWVHDYYMNNPDILNFVFNTSQNFSSAVERIAPLYVIGNALNSVILGIAPHLWLGLGGFGGPLIQYLANLDLASKYAVCQNLAAWLCATSTLTYGWYLTRKRALK